MHAYSAWNIDASQILTRGELAQVLADLKTRSPRLPNVQMNRQRRSAEARSQPPAKWAGILRLRRRERRRRPVLVLNRRELVPAPALVY